MPESTDPARAATETSKPDLGFAHTVVEAMEAEAREESPRLPVGAARYAVAKVIGEGGMGRVLEARDVQFSRTVALKQLLGSRTGTSARERFALEAMVTGNLEHPGVPTVYERGALSDGSPFYTMRLVRGRTLTQAIADAPDLAARLKLVPVVIKVAQTLGFAHERGIVHRDIKPDNIIVGKFGEAVVLDWGIAKVRGVDKSGDGLAGRLEATGASSSSQTQHGSIIGTPAYMAPEQASGKIDKIDERTDVFALGALLYHLLTGRPPYEGASGEVIARAVMTRIDPLASVAKQAPLGIRAICEKAMARSQDDRFQTASEFAGALETFTADAVAGRDSSALKWLTHAIAALGLLGALFSVFATWSFASSLREQGWPGLVVLGFFTCGCVLSAIEWRSLGRYHLSSLAIAFALGTLFIGLSGATGDVATVLRFLAKPEIIADGVRYRDVATQGLLESIGVLSTAAMFAAFQLMLWAIAARRVAAK